MVLGQPVQSIVDKETPHLAASGAIEIDRRAPWCSIAVGEVWAVLAKIISFRAQMVVDDIKHDREALAMTRVDQQFESGGTAIRGVRRVWIGAVVTPVARARNRRNRHKLDRRYPQRTEVGEPADHAVEGSLGRENPSMKFVDYEIFQRKPFPILIGPDERAGIDDLRGVMNSTRLKTRDRVRVPAIGRKLIGVLSTSRQTFSKCGEDTIRIAI